MSNKKGGNNDKGPENNTPDVPVTRRSVLGALGISGASSIASLGDVDPIGSAGATTLSEDVPLVASLDGLPDSVPDSDDSGEVYAKESTSADVLGDGVLLEPPVPAEEITYVNGSPENGASLGWSYWTREFYRTTNTIVERHPASEVTFDDPDETAEDDGWYYWVYVDAVSWAQITDVAEDWDVVPSDEAEYAPALIEEDLDDPSVDTPDGIVNGDNKLSLPSGRIWSVTPELKLRWNNATIESADMSLKDAIGKWGMGPYRPIAPDEFEEKKSIWEIYQNDAGLINRGINRYEALDKANSAIDKLDQYNDFYEDLPPHLQDKIPDSLSPGPRTKQLLRWSDKLGRYDEAIKLADTILQAADNCQTYDVIEDDNHHREVEFYLCPQANNGFPAVGYEAVYRIHLPESASSEHLEINSTYGVESGIDGLTDTMHLSIDGGEGSSTPPENTDPIPRISLVSTEPLDCEFSAHNSIDPETFDQGPEPQTTSSTGGIDHSKTKWEFESEDDQWTPRDRHGEVVQAPLPVSEGEYTVKLTVETTDGRKNSTTTEFRVTEPPVDDPEDPPEDPPDEKVSIKINESAISLGDWISFEDEYKNENNSDDRYYKWEFYVAPDDKSPEGEEGDHLVFVTEGPAEVLYNNTTEVFDITCQLMENGSGQVEFDTTEFAVIDVTADLSASDDTVEVGDVVTFDASDTEAQGADHDPPIDRYDWSVDGTASVEILSAGSDDTLKVEVLSPGSLTATVTGVVEPVEDTDRFPDWTGQASTTVTVESELDAAFEYEPSQPLLDETVTLDASSTETTPGSDPSYDWVIDQPDGSRIRPTGKITTFDPEVEGEYDVTLRVTEFGVIDTEEATFDVIDSWWGPYVDEDGIVQIGGFRTAVDDWQADELDSIQLSILLESWSDVKPVRECAGTQLRGATYGTQQTTTSVPVERTVSDRELTPGESATVRVEFEDVSDQVALYDTFPSAFDSVDIVDYGVDVDGNTETSYTSAGSDSVELILRFDGTASTAFVEYEVTAPATINNETTVEIDGETVAGDAAATLQNDQISLKRPPAPVAVIDGPTSSPTEGDLISFDGGGSLARSGSITKYEWNFGDGTRARSEDNFHSYDDSGTYTVTLTVTNSHGRTDTARETVTVESDFGGIDPIEPPVWPGGPLQGSRK